MPKDERDRLFEQVQAAKTYISTIRNQEHAEEVELAAFMSIFHPEIEPMAPCELRDMIRKEKK